MSGKKKDVYVRQVNDNIYAIPEDLVIDFDAECDESVSMDDSADIICALIDIEIKYKEFKI